MFSLTFHERAGSAGDKIDQKWQVAIIWCSKKLTSVAMSSTEYVLVSFASKEPAPIKLISGFESVKREE